MISFSEIYGLNKQQAELDFVDVTPGDDLPLYLDPYALTTREDTWSESAHQLIVSFFQEVLQAVKAGNKVRGIKLLSHLGEPEETHLGVSKKGNRGRGIGNFQATELYNALKNSKAADSGLLEDLSDFALFIPGIGRDKISDITTNVIRKSLIEYTQAQCALYEIPVRTVSSGFYWCANRLDWLQNYVELPVYESSKIILVPKFSVRYRVGVDHSTYRRMFVLEFLQEEHLRADDSLVTVLTDKDGVYTGKTVYKKTVDMHYPKNKDFLAEFSAAHPDIIDKYKDDLKEKASRIPDINGDNYIEAILASKLIEELSTISAGPEAANTFHNFCLSALSFIFFPNFIYPKKEMEINEGRKRIDIVYTNGKDSGFFYRIALDQNVKANAIHVECKNYTNDIKNPELDQLLGRFNPNRGTLGMLIFRSSNDLDNLIRRCNDAAKQQRGIVLPVDDEFIVGCLKLIESNNRHQIDAEIDRLYKRVIS